MRIDTGDIASKTFIVEADTFEDAVQKAWVKCQDFEK